MTHIEIDTRELEALSAKLDIMPRETKRAMVESLNRTLTKTISLTAKEVKKEYPSIARKDIDGIATKKKATFADTSAYVTYTGARLKASAFPHSISRSKNRSPVTLRIKKSKATSGSNPVMFGEKSGGSRGAKGTREVFKRSLGSQNVETVYTLSIPQMVSNETVFEQIAKEVQKHYIKTFTHQLDYRLGLIK